MNVFMSGPVQNNTSNAIIVISMVACTGEDKQLTKFWELIIAPKYVIQDDQLYEKLIQHTTRRNEDGIYTVKISFSSSEPTLGNSKTTATARLLQLGKNFFEIRI